jgi:hypothetical protein
MIGVINITVMATMDLKMKKLTGNGHISELASVIKLRYEWIY